MAKHITENEVTITGAALGQALIFNGTKFIPGTSGVGVDKVVANIAERDALVTTDFKVGQGVQVGDASGDPTVGSGFAYYKWSGTAYIKIGEAEANDAVADNAYDYTAWNGDVRHAPSKNVVADKFKQIEDLLDLLAPPRPPLLTGGTLTTGTPTYDARLSAGMTRNWYEAGKVSGDTITAVFVSSLTLNTPVFRSGVKDSPSTYGTLTLRRTVTPGETGEVTTTSTYDMSQGVGTNGVVSINAINTVSNYWSSAQAQVLITPFNGTNGYVTVQLVHSEAGASAFRHFVFDDHPTPLDISSYSSVVGTVVPKYLSGVIYLGLGSTVLVTATLTNLFDRTYAPNEVVRLSCPAGALNISPASVPIYADTLQLTSRVVTLSQSNITSLSPLMSIVGVRPNNVLSVTTPISQAINTYGTVSTANSEYFQDEAQRVYAATGSAFDSTASLPTTELQVIGGRLLNPGGTTRGYRRVFAHTSAATTSGTLTIAGLPMLSPYATVVTSAQPGVSLLLRLVTDNSYFDLGRPFGVNSGDGSGNSFANARGAQTTTNGNAVNFSFGTFTSANNGGVFELYTYISGTGGYEMNSIIVS